MPARAVMVEAQDALSIGSDAYRTEGHAFAYGGKVEHIAVGGKKRQMMCFQETAYAGSRVGSFFKQYGQIVCIFFG